MVAALFLTSLRDNGRLAARFCSAPVLRLPVLLLWVAVFGGSLHAPCTTFFYLSVGASQEQVGNISAVRPPIPPWPVRFLSFWSLKNSFWRALALTCGKEEKIFTIM